MSLSNLIRIPLVLPNVDVFTFGESSLFGYDSLNHCLIVHSLIEGNHLNNDQSINRLYLSSSPTSSIRQLILNPDETILALISDKIAYLVYLPQSNNSPSKGSRLCPINVVPFPPSINSTQLNNSLIDFLWLSSIHFVIVYSISSCECHLYIVRPLKHNEIKYIQTFSVGSISKKEKHSVTSNKRISIHQSSSIIKLDLAKRKQEDFLLLLIFAIQADGNIFIMEIDQNQLLNYSEKRLSSEFIGPIRIYPSTYDNYGSDYSHSNILCLSCSQFPLVIFTNGKCQINQCIVLNPSINEYYLFTIDLINLPKIDNNNPQIIKSMINNKLNSNIYYIYDSLSNVYSIEISWINQIEQKQKQIQSTNIQYIIKSNNFIQQFGLIQTNNKGQFIAILTKTQKNDQQKELILLRPNSLSCECVIPIKSHCLTESIKFHQSNLSSEFLNRIRTILTRDQSIPHLTISSSAQQNISNEEFQNNLIKFIRLFSEEYLDKQEKVRIELENKQRYLYDFQQTQLIAKQELDMKFQQIQITMQKLNQQYQQEYARRKRLSSNVHDHLSIIEQCIPVVSDTEILMQRQLEKYQVQINSLHEKLLLLKKFIQQQQFFTNNQQQIDQKSMTDIHKFVEYFRDQIDTMKQKLQPID
ncbi:unnamed protein product [Adineta steineri]|uniref:Uncharacterized protein n=1 Tax=Adineta steineri TaxID=433720 RepID=A0A814VV67_9BILA|nr:unnamed protein product [Adineta steineri]CAF3884979.1 unnamed protein product [Adineta steineri]